MEYELINPINQSYTALEQVLTNRGIKREDIDHYLHVSETDNLSPLLLNNIDDAIAMLIKHLSLEGNDILLCADCDCDGYTSAALLLNYIHAVFPTAIGKIRYVLHPNKQHGIIEEEMRQNTSLVIAPDASSNEYALHQRLVEKGIDVLVLDHHHADKVSEYACVVNNQLDNYPNKSLSGVGIVYKFCQRIDELLAANEADKFLDLVAVGLIGDMMDLRTMETHLLVQEGMRQFRNPFLTAMAEKNSFSLKSELTPIGIAFYIVPFINAMTRSGTMEEKTLLFESMLEWKADSIIPSTKRGCKGQTERLVEQAVRTCTNVKSRQTRNSEANKEALKEIIQEHDLLQHKLLLIKAEGIEIDRNVAGLIANQLMSEYQQPVAILSPVYKDDKLYWEGSARGVSNTPLTDFRSFCESSGLVNYAEGHGQAFGLSILDENFDKFVEYADETLKDIHFSPSYKVDFIYNNSSLNPQTILELGDAKILYGQEIAEPLIVVENIAVTKDMIMLMSRDKNPTLKIQLSNGVTCIKFKSNQEELDNLYSESGCVTISLVGKAEVNRYFNSVTPQIIIQDYEIISRQEYYF